MKRTTINGLILGLLTGLLASCGGTSDSSSGTKLLASEAACYSPWFSNVAYTGGQTVGYNGKNYTAAYWTQAQNPSTNNGPAGSGQPWLPGVICNPDPGVTPTPTPAPTCTPTPITPYMQVEGDRVRQTSTVGAGLGYWVKFLPEPSTGGSWSWSGCGTSGTSREQTVVAKSLCTATAVYTNSCGAQSTANMTVSISIIEPTPVPTPSPTCTPTPITPYLQVNGGTVRQTGFVGAERGDSVKFSPQPSTGGSWRWGGGCGLSGTSREQTFTVLDSCTTTAVYTNSCGAQSAANMGVSVSIVEPPPTPTPAPTPTDTCPPYVQGHTYATGAVVSNIGNDYQCTVGGWCSLNSDAYSPGTGWAWEQAWTQVTGAACGPSPTPTPAP